MLAAAHVERQIVDYAAIARMLRRENVVVERTLVEIGEARLGLPREQLVRQLQHVVDVAGLGRVRSKPVAEVVGGAEVLREPVATGDVGVVTGDAIPEEGCGLQIVRVTRQRVAAGQSDQLRNLRVGVQSGEAILPGRERSKYPFVVKAARQRQIPRVASVCVEIRKDLVHAAVLAAQHLLHLDGREPGQGASTQSPSLRSTASASSDPAR